MKRLLEWQIATVTSIHQETPRAKTFTLQPAQLDGAQSRAALRRAADRAGRLPGAAQLSDRQEPERSGEIDLTVERIDDGEVSNSTTTR